ncbi:hypothetical protein J437_LFUL007021 [Ladona fulva]|uniref:Uncharacterized protein n=1 Tax=Ladona fulva TaxID=123851 RepID=A0A8K0P0M8_LADFU|nr:hypothetical protein J437_LFUL007021 [Ladona fulva]
MPRAPVQFPLSNSEEEILRKDSQEEPEFLDLLGEAGPILNNTHFDGNDPTKVIIHGFGGGRKYSPSPDIRKGEDPSSTFNFSLTAAFPAILSQFSFLYDLLNSGCRVIHFS